MLGLAALCEVAVCAVVATTPTPPTPPAPQPSASAQVPAGALGRWWSIDGKAFYGTRAEAEAVASQTAEPKPGKPKPKAKPKVKPAPLSLVLEQMEAIALPSVDVSLYNGPEAAQVAQFLAALELQTEQMRELRAELDDEDVLLLTL